MVSALVVVVIFAASGFINNAYVVPVAMYHKIDGDSMKSVLSLSPESFERQMAFLRKHKYNIIPLAELARIIKEKKRAPSKTIAITFDDGYENNYTNAFPVLKRYDIPATIFVVIKDVGTDGFMTWGQIEEMRDAGIDIGSHTLTHPHLPSIDENRLISEVVGSKAIIESRLGGTVKSFSYPSGGFNAMVRKEVVDAGYEVAVATNPGKKYPKHDPYALKRLRISRTSDNLFVFWIETSGIYTFIKEHRDDD
ncbi:MAG: hypothetical protein AUJ75_01495 [Candidatus Omnitrophica bacterium CG1_02_49_10]|nr:MAG: hypothetical protein AUJ75_01495 [Candidatus Omnitrophica bacterium CG1_02_49_10]